ncbi:DNA-directed RNA polymerase I subunit [Escovopsis weberi]|uniref:DNA-directed RNA polymerase n=1 Tax=Escovopsis weberi TaxID=150374 RepID=A0A0M8MZ57_ESCWE|nr:DNA-directed RNA polymerase I subunit [Escovopsis weberi]
MNIAQPVTSEVESVEFTFLSAKEIKAISVKRIENESTFDNLLNPVPGGLYDPALGSWGDAPYTCQLRLLQHGLINEAHMVATIGENELAIEMQEDLGLNDSEAEEGESSSVDNVTRQREKYVQRCLRGTRLKRGDLKKGKHEGAIELRREIIKEFLAEIVKKRSCSGCGGISPTYRKDRFVKVFEKTLSAKEKSIMAQKNLKWDDAMSRVHQSKPTRKADGYSTDEGVADVESPTTKGVNGEVASSQQDVEMEDAGDKSGNTQRYISSMEVRARLEELFIKEQDLLSLVYNAKPPTRNSPRVTPEMFFINVILVPPNRYRPEARTGESSIAEAQQNSLYKSILGSCSKVASAYAAVGEKNQDITYMHQAWTELQDAVNSLIDKNKNPIQGAAAKRNEDGIKQLLEKKEGLFRKNMMGKRVNYAARSVISPDPNIETNEIGVPPVFAKKLTYPEPVTSHNFKDMQQAVINGVDKWPGAFAIENENGQIVNLRNKSVDDRISLANQLLAPTNSNAVSNRNKKVHRHLTNGDVVLMNRQPTLHKPSIMGHRVRVLPSEKTIRMHYANCNTYNADFDGDEMNMHFPQNEVARAEALQIADTDHHDYHQLIYSALRPESGHILGERIQLLPPAVIKPVPRWTGKQVISTILANIQPLNCGGLSMEENAQIKAEQWGSKTSEEGKVLIQDGEFITGILDKSQIGPSSGGLIHSVHEVYGPAVAGKLLSCLGRLLTRYLNMRAFSCGMDDLRLTPEGEEARRQALIPAATVGLDIASKYVSLENQDDPLNPLLLERLEEVMREDSKQEGLDLLMNQGTKDITDTVKTSRSGYLQRCVIKGMEGLTVAYDTTVRDADGSLIQFLYGEDGLDVSKQKYLTDFRFILQNVTSEAAQLKYNASIGERLGPNRKTFTKYMASAIKHANPRDRKAKDPLTASFDPATNAFATSETFFKSMTDYLNENPDNLVRGKGEQPKSSMSQAILNRKNAEMLFAMKYLRSLVEPGEAVGIVAGQSVGEPSTQMTLNTFHLAGHSAKNVTLGIPRLREILMTASRSISTPAMTLYPISELSPKHAEIFAKSISVLHLKELIDSVAVEEAVGRGKMYDLAKIYKVHLKFFPAAECSSTYAVSSSDILDTVEKRLIETILSLMKKEIKKRQTHATMATPEIGVKAGVVEAVGPEAEQDERQGGDDDDDDDDEGGDDATSAKQRANRGEAVSYGPNDDEDNNIQRQMARDAGDDDTEEEGLELSARPEAAGNDSDADEEGDGSSSTRWRSKAREDRVLDNYAEVTGFESDEKKAEWCSMTLEFDHAIPKVLMLNIVESAIKKTVVQQIAGVGACNLVEENGQQMIHTSGVNLRAMQRYSDFIDPNRIETNDIAAVLDIYGVEACRANIVRELSGVFGGHGIKVDNRHLNLIADHMTRNGDFTAFSRMGLKGNVSPFTKMSFETTLAFLKDAMLDGDWDDLTSPSGRLVMGKLGRVGTGGFDVFTQLPTHHADSLA